MFQNPGACFFEVTEAPQAARTQTHTAGRPETGKKGKFLATYDKSSTVSLTVSTFSKMFTFQNATHETLKYEFSMRQIWPYGHIWQKMSFCGFGDFCNICV